MLDSRSVEHLLLLVNKEFTPDLSWFANRCLRSCPPYVCFLTHECIIPVKADLSTKK